MKAESGNTKTDKPFSQPQRPGRGTLHKRLRDTASPAEKDEEREIFERIEAGDESAREPLIVHNLRLVVYIARKFENSGVGIEDLISIGTIGLIKPSTHSDRQRT